MAEDSIREELRLVVDSAREQFAADPREATADRLAQGVAESLSSGAKELAAYFVVRRWLLEARAIG